MANPGTAGAPAGGAVVGPGATVSVSAAGAPGGATVASGSTGGIVGGSSEGTGGLPGVRRQYTAARPTRTTRPGNPGRRSTSVTLRCGTRTESAISRRFPSGSRNSSSPTSGADEVRGSLQAPCRQVLGRGLQQADRSQ